MPFDQTKRCPRCQLRAPDFKVLKLDACLFCQYPGPDPALDDLAEARRVLLEQTNRRRI